MTFGSISFLLTSDIEAETETLLQTGETVIQSTVLKVAHHGSKTSSTRGFINKVSPAAALISVGGGNSYGHPNEDVLGRLVDQTGGENLYRTDRDGDVEFMEPEWDDSSASLRAAMANAELVFITAGMNRDIDPETVSRVSSIAKETQALVVGVVTAIFSFEESELSHAVAGADRLLPYVDGLIIIHNDRLPEFVDWGSGILPALANADEMVAEGIMDLSELLTCPGKIDVSLADFRSLMSQPGPAVMATGVGRGRNGAVEAAHQAIDSPFVEDAMKGAQGILFAIKGGENLTLGGVYSAGDLIGESIGKTRP